MICLAVTSCISLVANGLKRWRSVMWNWHYWLYLQEKDGVPLTPQVKVSSLRNNCSFPHPLSYSEKAHSDSSGLFLTHHSILKEACSAALFEVHILRDWISIWSCCWSCEYVFTSLTEIEGLLHASLGFLASKSSSSWSIWILRFLVYC